MKLIPCGCLEKELWDNEHWCPLGLKVGDCPNVLFYRTNKKFEASRWLTELTFNWGCHEKWGGCRTVMLPAIRLLYVLGFRNVYLLGCDLNMNENSKYHCEKAMSKSREMRLPASFQTEEKLIEFIHKVDSASDNENSD